MDVRTAIAVAYIEFMQKIDRRILANRRSSIDKTASEMSMSHGNKRCKNGTKFNRNIIPDGITKYENRLTTGTVKSRD